MTADSTGRILCDWIEGDETAPSSGRICYQWRIASAEAPLWVKSGKLDYCPVHRYEARLDRSGKSWRQT